MADSFSGKLQIWEGWSPSAVVPARAPLSASAGLPILTMADQYAEHLFASETLGPPPRRWPADGAEPYTLQWFLDVENLRHQRHGRWVPAVLEFAKHNGETLLGLGHGLGTDWVQYARHGASLVVCSPSVEQLTLVRRNFELRGLGGRFLHAPSTRLPVETASIDVVCLNPLLHTEPEPSAVIDELYRVLKPGGKVLAWAPAKYDVEFWRRLLFPWRRWWLRKGRDEDAPTRRFSMRALRGLFRRFVEHRVHKRHLRRGDVPPLWRLLPSSLLQRLLGRFLILKAFKPLSTAISLPVAA